MTQCRGVGICAVNGLCPVSSCSPMLVTFAHTAPKKEFLWCFSTLGTYVKHMLQSNNIINNVSLVGAIMVAGLA